MEEKSKEFLDDIKLFDKTRKEFVKKFNVLQKKYNVSIIVNGKEFPSKRLSVSCSVDLNFINQ